MQEGSCSVKGCCVSLEGTGGQYHPVSLAQGFSLEAQKAGRLPAAASCAQNSSELLQHQQHRRGQSRAALAELLGEQAATYLTQAAAEPIPSQEPRGGGENAETLERDSCSSGAASPAHGTAGICPKHPRRTRVEAAASAPLRKGTVAWSSLLAPAPSTCPQRLQTGKTEILPVGPRCSGAEQHHVTATSQEAGTFAHFFP